MPRLARIVIPHIPHHVIQRGNRKQDVFFSEEDRISYIQFLRRACKKYGVHIWAYCLMTNHVHLIAVPLRKESFSKCLSQAHVHYARRINSMKGWKGHLWQYRFISCPMDDVYTVSAIRYVELNPVRAQLTTCPWGYRWSSAAYHVGLVEKDPLITENEELNERIRDWKEFLLSEDEKSKMKQIERESYTGRPIGTLAFIKRLEKETGFSLIRKKVGRPKLNEKNISGCP